MRHSHLLLLCIFVLSAAESQECVEILWPDFGELQDIIAEKWPRIFAEASGTLAFDESVESNEYTGDV